MKSIFLSLAMVALCSASAAAQGTHLTNDPLTGLPLIPATDPTRSGAKLPNLPASMLKNMGNAPTAMPPAIVCKSKYQGNFYTVSNSKTDATITWYASHLHGFTKAQNSAGSTIVFFNGDRTLVVIVMGEPGGEAASVAYERYHPGLSRKTITGITQGKVLCP